MPIIRNPFRRAVEPVIDENARLSSPQPGVLSRTSSDNKSTDAKTEPIEYKLSEINDSGVYLPPSPTENKSFWSTWSSRSGQSSRRNVLDENEPFNISRESFDSYRRSFDISARSPIIEASPSGRPRQSFDVRHMRLPSSQSISTQPSMTRSSSSATTPSLHAKSSYLFQPPRFHTPSTEAFTAAAETPKTVQINAPSVQPEDPVDTTDEHADKFEEVGLNDAKPKRHGIFARFAGNSSSSNDTHHAENSRPNSSGMMGHSFFGRKRGQSGTGSELSSIKQATPTATPAKSGAAHGAGTPTQVHTPSRTQTPVQVNIVAATPPAPASVLVPASAPIPTPVSVAAQDAKTDA